MPTQPNIGTTQAMNQTGYTGGSQTQYYQALYDWIAPFFKDPKSFLHFERLIYASSQLDPLTTGRLRETYSNYSKSLIRPLFLVRKKMSGFNNKIIHTGITEEACSLILNSISTSILGKADQILGLPFISFLNQIGTKLQTQIFSLNYDSIPHYSNLEFETGFNIAEGKCKYFDLAGLQDSEKSHLLIQLHGSSRFGYPPSGRNHGRHLVVRFDDENDALDNRRTTATTATFNQDGSSNTHRLMITGMRKADSLLDEPFAAYFHKFRAEAMKSPVYIVIGYGGGDRHVNETLHSAFEYWKAKRKRLKIVWIGYASDTCFENDIAQWDVGSAILKSCGSQIGSTFGPDVANYLGRPRTLWKIERKKIQKMKLEFADVLLSFRGTNDTFKEHTSEIIDFVQGPTS